MSKNLSSKHKNPHLLIWQVIFCIALEICILIAKVYNAIDMAFAIYLTGIILVYTICMLAYMLNTKKNNIHEYTVAFNNSFGNGIKNLNLPAVFLAKTGEIIWESKLFEQMNLESYTKNILSEINKPIKKELPRLVLDSKQYLLNFTEINTLEKQGVMVILVDITTQMELQKELDDTRPAVGIITIDSLEEIIHGMEDLDRVNTIAKIDKEIIEWINKYNGIVVKTDKDKYLYLINKEYVKELQNNSFEILERISHISENIVKVPVTISIGLSYDDLDLYSRYKSATTALDIALGRGGNQAVVKNNRKFEIYDGLSIQKEKMNRVRSRTIAQALKDLIQKSDNVYVIGHKNTDIDCIGAAVGIYKIAKTYGKNAQIIVDAKNNTSTSSLLERLEENSEYANVFVDKEEVKKLDFNNSLLIIVDTHKSSYLASSEVLQYSDKVVIIDHHRRGPEFIDNAILTYHEVYASSTSELVTELLMYLDNVKLTPVEAETIFAGILIDTKNFTFKTGVRTFEVAAYLKKMGLDMTAIKQLFQNDFDTYMARVGIVKNAQIIDGKIAISCTDQDIKDISVISAQAADELLSITNIVASFVLCKVDDVIMISGRSLGDVNVQLILEGLGGGGHLTFAGAQLTNVTLEEAKYKLLKAIEDYYSSINE